MVQGLSAKFGFPDDQQDVSDTSLGDASPWENEAELVFLFIIALLTLDKRFSSRDTRMTYHVPVELGRGSCQVKKDLSYPFQLVSL